MPTSASVNLGCQYLVNPVPHSVCFSYESEMPTSASDTLKNSTKSFISLKHQLSVK